MLFLFLFCVYILEIHQAYLNHIQLETPIEKNSSSNLEEVIRTKRSINRLTNIVSNNFPAFMIKPGMQNTGGNDQDKIERIIQTNFNTTYIDLDVETNTNTRIYLLIILALISFKKLLQIIMISRLSFFTSVPDWVNFYYITFFLHKFINVFSN